MWPFKKRPRTKSMMKLTLIDGQEFTGKMYGDVAMSPWVSADLGGEKVYYPHHRVRDVRTWTEAD